MADNEGAVDLINYKGIYFDDDSGQKYQCPESGAHFEYLDMFRRLKRIAATRQEESDLPVQSKQTVNESKKIPRKIEPAPVAVA